MLRQRARLLRRVKPVRVPVPARFGSYAAAAPTAEVSGAPESSAQPF